MIDSGMSCGRQYFQGRLNASEQTNGTLGGGQRKNYYFNNWMTLLSQLPLLLFTLLNSILYQRSEVGSAPPLPSRGDPLAPPPSPPLCSRVSETIRIAGSLIFMLLLFLLTAVLVKVPMEEDCFFSVTMATIWFINCE